MKQVDIFITHYNEPWEVGKKAFDMLSLQRMIDWDDFSVTLVHDGTEPFPEEYFAGYPFKVEQVSIPHGGPSAARNYGIDHGDGEWIRWCDFDDMFYGVYSLRIMTDGIRSGDAKKCDMMWFDMVAEDAKDGTGRFLRTDRGVVLIHNKMFRRSFLQEHGIRYNEGLRNWHEDSAFLALIEMEIDVKRIGHIKCEAPVYAWIVRDGSQCNRPGITFELMKDAFIRHRYVQDEFLKRGKTGPYCTMSVRIMADAYELLVLEQVDEDTSEYEREVAEYYKAHREDFFKVSNDYFNKVLECVSSERGHRVEREPFLKWLRLLKEKHQDLFRQEVAENVHIQPDDE